MCWFPPLRCVHPVSALNPRLGTWGSTHRTTARSVDTCGLPSPVGQGGRRLPPSGVRHSKARRRPASSSNHGGTARTASTGHGGEDYDDSDGSGDDLSIATQGVVWVNTKRVGQGPGPVMGVGAEGIVTIGSPQAMVPSLSLGIGGPAVRRASIVGGGGGGTVTAPHRVALHIATVLSEAGGEGGDLALFQIPTSRLNATMVNLQRRHGYGLKGPGVLPRPVRVEEPTSSGEEDVPLEDLARR
jgi:hypothetical protein